MLLELDAGGNVSAPEPHFLDGRGGFTVRHNLQNQPLHLVS